MLNCATFLNFKSKGSTGDWLTRVHERVALSPNVTCITSLKIKLYVKNLDTLKLSINLI